MSIDAKHAVLVLSTAVLVGCQAAGSLDTKGVEAQAAPAQNPLLASVSKSVVGQLRIGEHGWAEVAGSLEAPGRIEADETRMARIGSPVAGRIVALNAVEGQEVHPGDVLATLHSTELSAPQLAFLRALNQQQLNQRAVVRAKQLLEAGVIGEAELQRRESELAQAGAELATSRDQMKVLGMSSEAVARLESTRAVNLHSQVLSTMNGAVLERKVTVGQVAQPADTFYVVADLSNVWLVADVPEPSAGHIRVGQSIEASVPALPGHTIRGRLSFVSATVNPETRTVRVRMDLANPKRLFKPAMLAVISLRDNPQRLPVVPSSAVVREENHDHVFVQTAPTAFLLREVTLGAEHGGRRVLISGISAGEKIVLDGAFHLNNERKRLETLGE